MAAIDHKLYNALEWRCIGPFRAGRVVAVAGDPVHQGAFYFGACSGGVWKTEDGGTNWRNVSDGQFNVASVGAVAVSDSDPNVVYVGTGESCIRQNVSHGDGVYKSTDGGATWRNVGLERTRHIARVRVHPQDPDLVYVAAFGHAYGRNPERGVYRSKDGGETWELVLHKSDRAGAVDISMDANNPASCTPPSIRPSATPGYTKAAAKTAASTSPPTAATPGRTSPRAPVCPMASWAESESPPRRPGPAECGRSSSRRTAASSARTTAATTGSSSPTPATSAAAPGTTPTSSPTPRTPRRCTRSNSPPGAPSTAAATSRSCPRRTATTTTCG